jgi:CpeT/CpcT family (DUF1001)
MKKITLFTLCLVCALASVAQKNTAKPSLKDDMKLMLQWFEGEFDNFQQVYKEKEEKAANVHEHIHSIFKPVSLPLLGRNVFYVLQYMDGDSTKIYRQRLYSFSENKTENAIQLDIYSFNTDSLYYYAHLQPAKLSGLTISQLSKTDGCEVFWKRTVAATAGDPVSFTGYMKEKACNFISKRSGKRIFITDSLKLTTNEIWIRDEAVDENGGYVFGNKDKIPHKLKRCRFYKGWILLEKAGLTGEYHQMRNLTWHDQGKRVRLYTEDGKATKYEVELASVLYGSNLEVLKVAIYEVGLSKAVAYAWATPGAKNIGINLRWIQSGLTLVQ